MTYVHRGKQPKAIERFWSAVSVGEPESCWEWKRVTTFNGYGRLTVLCKGWLAHRMAWTLANGPIPDDLCILHRCDNRLCCNPSHLFLGTYLDNYNDMRSKGRMRTMKGQKMPPRTQEHRDNLAAVSRGRKASPEARENMRLAAYRWRRERAYADWT